MAAYNNMNKNEENASGGGSNYGWQQPTTLPVVQPMPAIPYVGPPIPYVGPKPGGVSGSSGTTPIMDPENLHAKNFAFNEDSIRKGFIRKVYLILMGQLLFTFGIVAVFLFHEPTQLFTQQHPEVLLVSVILAFGVVISMACCETTRRTFPTNFICLGIFTICESIMLGAVSSTYKSEEVFMAIGITAFLCLTLTIFAMQTKYDFTACGGILLLSLVALILFGFVAMFWRDHVVQMIYASVGALLACIFLIYDTQMMMGGTHKYSISPEEYIFAALNLYMDVVRIFLYVLRLIGSRK